MALKFLLLQAYNVAGQNKNRLVLSYLCWLRWKIIEDIVELYLLVAVHSKNVCDSGFGHIKWELSHNNAHFPHEAMRITIQSSKTSSVIPTTQVYWHNWKVFLGHFSRVPASLTISKCHVLTARKDYPGFLCVRKLQGSADSEALHMLKPPRRNATTEVEPLWIHSELFSMTRTLLD